MGSDGRYNVEGQIRCNTDSSSLYGCAILNDETPEIAAPEVAPLTPPVYYNPDNPFFIGRTGQDCNETCSANTLQCDDSFVVSDIPGAIASWESVAALRDPANANQVINFYQQALRQNSGLLQQITCETTMYHPEVPYIQAYDKYTNDDDNEPYPNAGCAFPNEAAYGANDPIPCDARVSRDDSNRLCKCKPQ